MNQMTVTKLWSEGNNLQNFSSKDRVLSENTIYHISNGVSLNSNANPKVKKDEKFEQLGNKTECSLLEMIYKWGFDFRDIRKKYADHVIYFIKPRLQLLFHSAHQERECLVLSKLTINSIFIARGLLICYCPNAQNMLQRMVNLKISMLTIKVCCNSILTNLLLPHSELC